MKTSLKIATAVALVIALAGCGNISRGVARVTGHSTVCVDGVTYLQFPSGVTVKVDRNGKPVPC